jgi:hypothetical protein
MCELHVEVLSAIRLYRFRDMCKGIMNISVLKVFLLHAKQAWSVGRGIALPKLNPCTRRGSVVSATPRVLYLWGTIVQEAG